MDISRRSTSKRGMTSNKIYRRFIEKRIEKYYFCANCITVPKELEKEVCAKSYEQQETRRLRKEIQRCENLVKTVDENIKKTNKLLSEKAQN